MLKIRVFLFDEHLQHLLWKDLAADCKVCYVWQEGRSEKLWGYFADCSKVSLCNPCQKF